ncbi:MAG: DNA repair protein RadA/Sms [Paraglaciecola sp.]|jgi:DNA repair protein RadA/Sms
MLIGGSSGAGKSTLLLQVMFSLAAERNTCYATGEEPRQQVAMRAQRVGLAKHTFKLLSEPA